MAKETEKKDLYRDNLSSDELYEEDIHLRDYLQVVLKHKWTVITFFIVIVTTVAIGSFSMKPIYTATTTIQIEREPPKILKFEDVLPIDAGGTDYYQTQYKIIQSRTIAKNVVERLSLWNHPQFEEKELIREARAEVVKGVPLERLIDSFLDLLEVEPIRNSRLVKIKYSSNYPDLSAEVANAIANTYIDYNLESKFKATEKARNWLSNQLIEFQAKVERSEEILNNFARRHGIFSLEKDENLVLKRLEDLNEALSAAESDRIAKESFYKEVRQYDTKAIPASINNDLINDLKKEHSGLEAEYFKLSRLYKPDYPRMVRLKAQMGAIEKRIEEEIENLVKGAEGAYKISLNRERLFRNAFEKQKELALKMKENSIKYNIHKREVDTNKELYDGLLQRVKETGVSGGLESSNIRVVDVAVLPQYPSKPKKGLNILLSMVVGLFMGVGFAFFFEYLDNTVKNPDEMERYFKLFTLGLVPSLESVSDKGKTAKLPPGLISYLNTRSPLSEAFRTLRTSLLFSSPGQPPKTLLITSIVPGEGKTTVTANLGIVLAQTGKRVLIVDGDLRRTGCHKVFSLPSSPGLTNYLTGNADLKSIVKSTKIHGLFVIPAGPIPPNPAELLSSNHMKELLEKLSKYFDFIIIDSPPVIGFADTPTLTALVDGVILVIFGGETARNEIKRTIQHLRGVNAPILGAVLNRFNIRRLSYGYYNSSYYYYYRKEEDKDIGKDTDSRQV